MPASKPPSPRPEGGPVPAAVAERLGLYLRELQQVLASGSETTSSGQLGMRLGISDAQVRKDLAHFGQFGQPGVGYRCADLIAEIRRILGTDRPWRVALMGVGNLGRALLRYRGFSSQGFTIAAAFDADPQKVGKKVEGVEVFAPEMLAKIAAREGIELGVIAVPAERAQEAADQLVAAGIRGILNFAPIALSAQPEVTHVGVDLARELEQVAFAVASRQRQGAADLPHSDDVS